MSYADRLVKEAISKTEIIPMIQAAGCEIRRNARPAPADMLDLCPVARLMRFFPDYRFRWPGTEWGLVDFKASDLIELAAWASYRDLERALGPYHVIVASPYGWAPAEDLRLVERPEGGYQTFAFRSHLWAAPRINSSNTKGSGTPYSQSVNLEPYGRWGMIRSWLLPSRETVAIAQLYEIRCEP